MSDDELEVRSVSAKHRREPEPLGNAAFLPPEGLDELHARDLAVAVVVELAEERAQLGGSRRLGTVLKVLRRESALALACVSIP